MSKHLYEISADLKALEKLAEDGELDAQTIADTMEGITGDFESKAVGVVTVSRRFNDNIETIDNEIKRLQARKSAMKNKQDSLIDYLRHNMEASEITKIECPVFTITLVKGKDMVSISDVNDLPTDFVNITTDVKPMKREILERLKAGDTIAGAIMVKGKSLIRIK